MKPWCLRFIKTTMAMGLCWFFSICYGQNYKVRNFDEDDGLNQNSVYSISQDNQGYIWIGTDVGLYRYDGLQFTNYGIADGLHDYEIFGISPLKNGVTVLAPHSGKLNYMINGTIYGADHDSLLRTLDIGDLPVTATLNDSCALVFGKGRSFFYKVTFNSGCVSAVKRFDLAPEYILSTVNIEGTDCVLFADFLNLTTSRSSVIWFNLNTEKIDTIFTIIPTSLYSGSLKNGYLQVSVDDGLIARFHKNDPTQKIIGKLPSKSVNDMITISDDHTWCATTEGLCEFKHSLNPITHLPNTTVNTVFMDRDSNIWAGTVNKGLYCFSPTPAFLYNPIDPDMSSGTLVLTGTGSSIFMGLSDLNIGNISNGNLKKIPLTIPANDHDRSARILDLTFVNRDTLLVATDFGVFSYSISSGKNSYVNTFYRQSAIKGFAISSDRIWIAFHNGLWSIDHKLKSISEHFKGRVASLCIENDDNLWFTRHTGLYIYKPSTCTIDTVPGPFSDLAIRHMTYDSGYIYLATGLGIYRINSKTYETLHISKGLKSTNTFKVHKWGDAIWAATQTGLCKIKITGKSTYNVKNYTTDHGLPSNRVNDVYIYNDSIWVATAKGISVFKESWLHESESSPTNILLFRSEEKTWDTHTPIVLNPKDRNITIHFVSPVYDRSINYEYRLLPGNDDWIPTDANSVSFSELGPGEYTFQVRNTNYQGLNPGFIAEQKFEILPRYYETLWFKISVIILIGILILAFNQQHSRRIRAREALKRKTEKQLASMELEAIKAQINPHFVYNCLNSIRYSILNNNTESAEKQISIFAKLIRKTLDFSKLDFISLSEEIDYLEKYITMERLRFKENLDIEITCDLRKRKGIMVPTMLIQPFVENAIKHGMQGTTQEVLKVRILFKLDDNVLICTVDDSGPGFKPNQPSHLTVRHGIDMTYSRAATYNMLYQSDIKINVKDKKTGKPDSSGVLVEIQIPLTFSKKRTYESVYNGR